MSEIKLKKCPECDGSVMQHFDTCPHCGCCQSKRCERAEKEIRARVEEDAKKPRLKPRPINTLTGAQGYDIISP